MANLLSPEGGVWEICSRAAIRRDDRGNCLVVLGGDSRRLVRRLYDALDETKVGGVGNSCSFLQLGQYDPCITDYLASGLSNREFVSSNRFFKEQGRRIGIAYTDDLPAVSAAHGAWFQLLTVNIRGFDGLNLIDRARWIHRALNKRVNVYPSYATSHVEIDGTYYKDVAIRNAFVTYSTQIGR